MDHFAEIDWVLNRMIEESVQFFIECAPTLKQYTTDILLDIIFVPRIIAKQMLLAFVLETGRFAISQTYYKLFQGFLVKLFSSRARMLRQLALDQQKADSQDEYMMLAEQMDDVTGNQEWRTDSHCALYEKERITTTIDHYLHLMRRNAIFDLLFVLRGNLSRNQFGLQHKSLFSKAQAGTKILVETYHNVVCAALDFVCDVPTKSGGGENSEEEEDIPTDVRLAFFNEVRHAFGRTALLLSGGAALGFYHVGVVKALMENNLMPRVIGGASAGSIVCAMVGTRTDEECIHDLFQMKGTNAPGHSGKVEVEFFRPLIFQSRVIGKANSRGFRNVYQNNAGAFHDSKRTWQFLLVPIALRQVGSALFDLLTGNRRPSDLLKNDTEHFKAALRTNCGNFTFQEAFDRTGRIINIIVSPKNSSDPPRLLNYLTSPHVLVWSAAVASASVPGIFEADSLMVKDPDGVERYESSVMSSDGRKHANGVKFSDGSFEQDLPMQQLSEIFNVNHFIISQVNPQAVLFGSYNHRANVWSNPIKGMFDSLLRFLKHQGRSWMLNMMKCFGSNRFRPLYAQTRANIGTQILTQEYEGRDCDISLIPWLHHRDLRSAFLHMLYNPTAEDFFDWMKAAERETWKCIPRIKCHIAEEIVLDQCVQRLRRRLMLESWHRRRGGKPQMKNGLPSFYVSPSLTNLETHKETAIIHHAGNAEENSSRVLQQYTAPLKNPVGQTPAALPTSTATAMTPMKIDVNSGWGGLGLRGNRSSGSLDRQSAHPSGLFFDEEGEDNPQEPQQQQEAGEYKCNVSSKRPSTGSLRSGSRANSYTDCDDSFQPATMATFYYRKSNSYDNMHPSSDANLSNLSTVTQVHRTGRSESVSSQHENFF